MTQHANYNLAHNLAQSGQGDLVDGARKQIERLEAEVARLNAEVERLRTALAAQETTHDQP